MNGAGGFGDTTGIQIGSVSGTTEIEGLNITLTPVQGFHNTALYANGGAGTLKLYKNNITTTSQTIGGGQPGAGSYGARLLGIAAVNVTSTIFTAGNGGDGAVGPGLGNTANGGAIGVTGNAGGQVDCPSVSTCEYQATGGLGGPGGAGRAAGPPPRR